MRDHLRQRLMALINSTDLYKSWRLYFEVTCQKDFVIESKNEISEYMSNFKGVSKQVERVAPGPNLVKWSHMALINSCDLYKSWRLYFEVTSQKDFVIDLKTVISEYMSNFEDISKQVERVAPRPNLVKWSHMGVINATDLHKSWRTYFEVTSQKDFVINLKTVISVYMANFKGISKQVERVAPGPNLVKWSYIGLINSTDLHKSWRTYFEVTSSKDFVIDYMNVIAEYMLYFKEVLNQARCLVLGPNLLEYGQMVRTM